MSQLSKNIIYNVAGNGATLLLGLFSVKYIYHGLGEEAFGIFSFVTTFNLILLSSLNKGVTSTSIREIAQNIKHNKSYVYSFTQTCSMICWTSFLIFAIAVYFLAPIFVDKWINIKNIPPETAVSMMRILGCASLLALPRSLYMSFINGLQKMEYSNIVNVLSGILQRLGIIFILLNKNSIIIVISWITFCNILIVMTGFIISSRLLTFRALLPSFSKMVFKKNLAFGMQMTWISILAIFQKQIDKITLSKLLPIEILGYYSFAFNNLEKGLMLSQAISKAAYPTLCNIHKNQNHDDFVHQYNKLHNLTCYTNIPIFMAAIIFVKPLFTYIFNNNVAMSLQIPVALLCLCFYLNSTMSMLYRVIISTGSPAFAVRINIIGLFVTIPLTLLFTFLWGMNGAAIGWLSFQIVAYIFYVPKVYNEHLKISVLHFFSDLFKIFSITTISYGSAKLYLFTHDNSTIMHYSLAYFGATVIFFGMAYFLIGKELRNSIDNYIDRFLSRVNCKYHSIIEYKK